MTNKTNNDIGFRIFVLEDNEFYGEALKHYISSDDSFDVQLFLTGRDLLKNLHLKPDVITLDYSLPDISGEEVFKRIKDFDSKIPVVFISSQEDISTVVDLLKDGAYDYIEKNNETNKRLWSTLNKLKERQDLHQEIAVLREEVGKKYKISTSIVGESKAIKQVFKLIEKAGTTNITVSIFGETGTGKEMVAKAIHYNSKQKDHPFIAVNMAAIPSELIESELFGHEKGAFTGAIVSRAGFFERAGKGTLFLDEIGELDISLQSKLLRVLQEREIIRVGGEKVIPFNARVIVATHKNLSQEVDAKNFRQDLFYRILGLNIQLPPLREREGDVILLARYFIAKFCKENDLPLKTLSPAAIDKLLKYPFPGNVRELSSLVELACVLADKEILEEYHFNFLSQNNFKSFLTQEMSLEEYNLEIIKHYLEKYNNSIMTVAKKLKISKTKLYDLRAAGQI